MFYMNHKSQKNVLRSREELLKRNEENSESSEEICKNTEYNKHPETHEIRKHTPY